MLFDEHLRRDIFLSFFIEDTAIHIYMRNIHFLFDFAYRISFHILFNFFVVVMVITQSIEELSRSY